MLAHNPQFYFLQILKSKDGKAFYTHTRWGRVGELGQSKTVGPDDVEAAIKEFEKKFKDKSGLAWSDRNEESKGGKKYTYLEKNYDDEEDDEDQNGSDQDDSVKSKLPLPTQRLIELIFVSTPSLAAELNPHHLRLLCFGIGIVHDMAILIEKHRTRITSMPRLKT